MLTPCSLQEVSTDVRSATGHSWDESYLITIVYRCLLALKRANLLAVDEDVDMALNSTIPLTKLLFETWKTSLEILNQ